MKCLTFQPAGTGKIKCHLIGKMRFPIRNIPAFHGREKGKGLFLPGMGLIHNGAGLLQMGCSDTG